MSLKYSFAFAVLIATVVFGMGQLGLLSDVGSALPYVLAALVLVAAAGAWFVDLLDRRLSAMQQAVQKLAGGEDSLRLDLASRGAPDHLARPFADMAHAVNQRLSELHTVIAQQRAIAEHGPDAMWVFDVESFRLIDANENFAKLTGHPRSRLIGMSPMDIAPAEQSGMSTEAYAHQLIERALAGEKLEVPWIVRHVDGTDVPCELRAIHLPSPGRYTAPGYGDAGASRTRLPGQDTVSAPGRNIMATNGGASTDAAFSGASRTRLPGQDTVSAPGRTLICGLLLDVSERHRTLSELDRRMRFESLVTRLSTGFISLPIEEADEAITDALGEVGRFAAVDRAYLFEFSAGRERVSCTNEWCAHGIDSKRGHTQDLPASRYVWCLSRLQRGEVVAVERITDLPREAAAEREQWEGESIRSVLLVPMRADGGVIGYVGFDSVRTEVQWPAQMTTLLKLFGEMASNLLARKRSQLRLQEQNETLARANTELARSNQELQQFAYIASHDLQEPLRAIGGFSGLLARRYRGKLDEQAEEYLSFLTEAATRMQRMIVDLLDYSRLGHEPKPFQPVRLRDPLDAALNLLQAAVQELRAEFLIGDLPTVQGDGQQLTQLFQNLIGNALKFHGESPPSIMVSSRRSGNEWVILVRDNGIGIDPDKAADVFQIFRRLHAQEQYPGTGIGLAVCKRIVERHRGRIWVQPNDDRPGTTFAFALPASAESTTEELTPRWPEVEAMERE